MSYLSQIWVGKDEAASRCLRDAYAWHQEIWKAFPDRDGAHREFIFRLDDRHDRFRLLLLSPQRPVLPEWGEWRTKEVAKTFLAHERYRFQLRANPTVKRVVLLEDGSSKKNGRRTAICGEVELRAWLDRKADQSGFEIEQCLVGPPMESCFVKDHARGKHSAVDYQGVLRVKDREAFEHAFHRGIGPAKAFGFGLLMLQPVG